MEAKQYSGSFCCDSSKATFTDDGNAAEMFLLLIKRKEPKGHMTTTLSRQGHVTSRSSTVCSCNLMGKEQRRACSDHSHDAS